MVQNQDQYRQARYIAMVLVEEKEGEIKLVYRIKCGSCPANFYTGTFLVDDLIPLNSCTGWDYHH